MQSFVLKFLGVTILQGVKFPIFLLIFEWALQQCSATALPVINHLTIKCTIGKHAPDEKMGRVSGVFLLVALWSDSSLTN